MNNLTGSGTDWKSVGTSNGLGIDTSFVREGHELYDHKLFYQAYNKGDFETAKIIFNHSFKKANWALTANAIFDHLFNSTQTYSERHELMETQSVLNKLIFYYIRIMRLSKLDTEYDMVFVLQDYQCLTYAKKLDHFQPDLLPFFNIIGQIIVDHLLKNIFVFSDKAILLTMPWLDTFHCDMNILTPYQREKLIIAKLMS